MDIPHSIVEEISLVDALADLGENLAAGYLELPDATPLERMARGLCRQLERADLPTWRGEPLYPAGAFSWYSQGAAVTFHYSHSMVVDRTRLSDLALSPEAGVSRAYDALRERLGDVYQVGEGIDPDVGLGGRNYTHSILNYGRVVREGLCAYEDRMLDAYERARAAGDAHKIPFYAAMADVLKGIRAACARTLDYLRSLTPGDAESRAVLGRLIRALDRVPWQPARSFYEGLVAVNLLYYLDGTDSLGRIDRDLGDLYAADLRTGALTQDQGEELVGHLWENVDANSGWNVAIGGSGPDGSWAGNALTLACLRAAKGRRRPNLALCLTEDTPDLIWDAALDAIATGCGIPALYSDRFYLEAIPAIGLAVAQEDLHSYAFGGCTELMVHGCSNVGSLDAGLNLPLILSRTLQDRLAMAQSFDALWDAFAENVRETVARLVAQVKVAQAQHARHQPQPLRSLLIDDCLDRGVAYNAGGARYNWSVVNVGGLGNVADSLAAVRELIYERGELSGPELLRALDDDLEGHAGLRERMGSCPRYGNDDPRADELAGRIAELVFAELGRHRPWRGGRFLPACLMFVTYAKAGEPVMATPDGRQAGEPIADSIGPAQGRDRKGPSAMIRSVAGIPQHLAPGTLVTNFRFAPSVFEGEGRQRLVDLIKTYFALGGMQAQITVVDQAVLCDAVAHPDRYGDLIVRIGGYSEYWRNLSQTLRESVLQRTDHSLA